MNNYSNAAFIKSITRTKIPGLPIRYMDICLELMDGTEYNFTWSHSPSISTSACSYGNKQPSLFDILWNNTEIRMVNIHHKGDISAQYISPMLSAYYH